MKPKDFWEIYNNDSAGPNLNKAKAEKLRTFIIPHRFAEPGSPASEPRTVNIFAAIVCKDIVWVIMDFARLIRLHVISLQVFWKEDDIQPRSKVCESLVD